MQDPLAWTVPPDHQGCSSSKTALNQQARAPPCKRVTELNSGLRGGAGASQDELTFLQNPGQQEHKPPSWETPHVNLADYFTVSVTC